MLSVQDIRKQSHVISQKITSYVIGCNEVWGGNDVTTEDIPNYLVKLYCGIIRNIQSLWDALASLEEKGELTQNDSDRLSNTISDLERQLAKSTLIPNSTQIKELSSREWIICQAEVNTRKYYDQRLAEQPVKFKLEKILENEQANTLLLPNISGAISSTATTPRRVDPVGQNGNEKKLSTPLPSLKSSNSLVGSPSRLSPPSPTDVISMSKISHGFNPPNLDTSGVKESADYVYGEQTKPQIATLTSATKTRLTPKWRSNVGYPYGSSFPQLPPISKKRRVTGARQDTA